MFSFFSLREKHNDGLKKKKYGAAQRNKLEPLAAPRLLEELEDWSAVINAEPEIQKALKASVGIGLQEMEP